MSSTHRPLYVFDLVADYPLLGGVADAAVSLLTLLAGVPGLEPRSVRQLLACQSRGENEEWADREHRAAHWLAKRVPHSILFFPNFYSPVQGQSGEGGLRVVNLIHDLQFLHQPQFFSKQRRRWLREQFTLAGQRANLLLFVSEATRSDYFAHFAAPCRSAVIGHPISPGRPLRLEGQRPYLLTCSHYDFHPHKNFAGTLALFANLARHPAAPTGLELHITGHGRDNFEREMLGKLPSDLRSRVVHHGFVSSRRLERLHRGARAHLSLSLFEGFNLSAAQAASHGVPLLLSDLPVHRELYPQALYLNPSAPDPNQLLAFIRQPRHVPWPRADEFHPQRVAERYAAALAPLWH